MIREDSATRTRATRQRVAVSSILDEIDARPRVGFFPGSTIGNFEPEDAAEFLRQAGRVLGQGATMIVGVDLHQGHGGAQRRLQ